MDALAPDLERLEEKLNRLKREYDLFLAGQRRVEPSAFRDEVEREVLLLTKHPFHSTASRFRVKNLAHRFQALENQIRNLLEKKQAKKKGDEEGGAEAPRPSVLVDRAALENPVALESHFRALHRALTESLPGRPPPALHALEKKILDEARRVLERPGLYGIRFALVEDEAGLKIRGEAVSAPKAR